LKKVSIIIPSLNEEKLIERLLSQFTRKIRSENNLEIIVSDGGSIDLTIQIAKKYADRVILKKDNFQQNISQGRNEGAKNSLGDVLIFLNADTCVSDIEKFFALIKEVFKEDSVAAVTGPIEVFIDERIMSDRVFHFMFNNYVALLNRFVMGMGRGECHIIRRDKFFESGGYDETLAAGEDFDLYKRLRKLGKIIYRKDMLIYESPRRYRKFGYSKVFWDWTKNSLSVLLFKRSVSKKWEAVR